MPGTPKRPRCWSTWRIRCPGSAAGSGPTLERTEISWYISFLHFFPQLLCILLQPLNGAAGQELMIPYPIALKAIVTWAMKLSARPLARVLRLGGLSAGRSTAASAFSHSQAPILAASYDPAGPLPTFGKFHLAILCVGAASSMAPGPLSAPRKSHGSRMRTSSMVSIALSRSPVPHSPASESIASES